jgi:hypothetical protein
MEELPIAQKAWFRKVAAQVLLSKPGNWRARRHLSLPATLVAKAKWASRKASQEIKKEARRLLLPVLL